LVATEGDIDSAIELMRKSGQAKADKKAGRIAAEGIVHIVRSEEGKDAIIIEVNCETDFVARDDNFKKFVTEISQLALQHKVSEVEQLLKLQINNNDEITVEQTRQALVTKLGENINIRRLQYTESDNVLGMYLHSNRIAVIVALQADLQSGKEDLAKDLAMHIAATNPMVVKPEDVPAAKQEKEKEIFLAQAEASGKPAEIINKMVQGRIQKYLDEVSLLGQSFVKDPSTKVAKVLQQKAASVDYFVRYEVGEGIEKKEVNFVAEVMSQLKD